jgi:hypothetical protein
MAAGLALLKPSVALRNSKLNTEATFSKEESWQTTKWIGGANQLREGQGLKTVDDSESQQSPLRRVVDPAYGACD